MPIASPPPPGIPPRPPTRLQAWLGRTFGPEAHPAVTGLSSSRSPTACPRRPCCSPQPGTRAARRTEQPMVARIEPPATDYPVFPTYDLGMQFRVMRLVGEHTSVPVPRTLWYEPDPTVLGWGVLRDGPGGRAGPSRRAALHLRRQLGLRRRPGRPTPAPAVGHRGHGRDPHGHPRPVTTSGSSGRSSSSGRAHRTGWDLAGAARPAVEAVRRLGGAGLAVPTVDGVLRLAGASTGPPRSEATPCRGGTVASAT